MRISLLTCLLIQDVLLRCVTESGGDLSGLCRFNFDGLRVDSAERCHFEFGSDKVDQDVGMRVDPAVWDGNHDINVPLSFKVPFIQGKVAVLLF